MTHHCTNEMTFYYVYRFCHGKCCPTSFYFIRNLHEELIIVDGVFAPYKTNKYINLLPHSSNIEPSRLPWTNIHMPFRVWPNIQQCQIIRPDIRYTARKSWKIRQGMPANPARYPASRKKNQICPNPSFFTPYWIMMFLAIRCENT